MPYHALVVFTSGYDFLFKSTLGHCDIPIYFQALIEIEKRILLLGVRHKYF